MKNAFKNKMIVLTFIIIIISITNSSFASTDQAGLFCTSDLTNSYGRETLNLVEAGMINLGYDIVQKNDSVTSKSIIMNYIGSYGSNYGLYIDCHAGIQALAVINGQLDTYIYPSEITGNWHFVFLDGCSTAENSTWANAFNTIGYTNRAFLGWYTTVNTGPAYEFAQIFWDEVGTKSLRDAALSAANSVPGSGTTPIRMYGDTSYYGWAW